MILSDYHFITHGFHCDAWRNLWSSQWPWSYGLLDIQNKMALPGRGVGEDGVIFVLFIALEIQRFAAGINAICFTHAWDWWCVIGPVIYGESKSQATWTMWVYLTLCQQSTFSQILGCILYWRFWPNWISEEIRAGDYYLCNKNIIQGNIAISWFPDRNRMTAEETKLTTHIQHGTKRGHWVSTGIYRVDLNQYPAENDMSIPIVFFRDDYENGYRWDINWEEKWITFVSQLGTLLKQTHMGFHVAANRMAWQWAETLVEIRGTLADIRGTTKWGSGYYFPKHGFNRPVRLEAHHYLLAHLSQ